MDQPEYDGGHDRPMEDVVSGASRGGGVEDGEGKEAREEGREEEVGMCSLGANSVNVRLWVGSAHALKRRQPDARTDPANRPSSEHIYLDE